MASLRRRAVGDEKSPETEAAAPVDSVEKLLTVVKQAKQTATEKGVTENDFKKFMGTAAKKNHLKLVKKQKPPEKKVPKSSGSLWSKVLFCYKVFVVVQLICLTAYLIFLYNDTIAGIILKVTHDRLYHIIRPVRMAIAIVAPVFSFVGLDFVGKDCVLENPFLNEIHSCPCLHVKLPKELIISDALPTIPDNLFSIPNHDIHVVRGAADTSNVTVEHFQDFKRNHPTHRGPKTCQKLTTNSKEGVQKMSELYNPELMKDYLEPEEPWAFTWEECPTEDRPQTFHSLLPTPSYLPADLDISSVSVFTLSTQWATAPHSESSFPEGSLMVMLVVMGEIRVSVDPSNPDCYDYCTSFRKQMILKAGDVLLFDQVHWSYMAVTWSKYAITTTVAVFKPLPS